MEIITLGIGTPSSIPMFLTLGLGDFGAAIIDVESDVIVVMAADVTRIVMVPDVSEVEAA